MDARPDLLPETRHGKAHNLDHNQTGTISQEPTSGDRMNGERHGKSGRRKNSGKLKKRTGPKRIKPRLPAFPDKPPEPPSDRLCHACGDPAKIMHAGVPLCSDCHDELALGIVKDQNLHFAGNDIGSGDDEDFDEDRVAERYFADFKRKGWDE